MTEADSVLSLLTEENKLLGYALWKALESHINYDSAHVGNQPQGTGYNSEAPQTVNFSFGHESHGIAYEHLPPDFYPYSVSFPIGSNPKGTFTITQIQPDGANNTKSFLITEISYGITFHKFIKLLPHLNNSKLRGLLLSMLDVEEVNEYCCSKDDTGMWEG